MNGRNGPTEPQDDETVHGVYDWSKTAPSGAVVELVAAATGRTETDIDPLYETVDPDALDAAVRSGKRDGRPVVVTVVVEGHRVEVYGDGRVVVHRSATTD